MKQEYKKFLETIPRELVLLDKILTLSEEELVTRLNHPVYPDWVFDDPHIHYPKPRTEYDLELMLKAIFSKLDRTSLTYWKDVKKVFQYQDLIEILENGFNDYKIDNRGKVSIIKNKDKEVEIYPSQEIRTNSHMHITAEGCLSPLEEGLDPRKTIELIHKQGGIAIVEHPCTKEHKIKQYTRTTNEEDKLALEVFELADAAEVFNSCNSLWMAGTNSRAKNLVDKFNKDNSKHLAKIAGSDIHYGCPDSLSRRLYLTHLGSAGIYLPKHELKDATGQEILDMKLTDLKNGNYERFENYKGSLTFFWTMVPPIIFRKLGIDGDSIS